MECAPDWGLGNGGFSLRTVINPSFTRCQAEAWGQPSGPCPWEKLVLGCGPMPTSSSDPVHTWLFCCLRQSPYGVEKLREVAQVLRILQGTPLPPWPSVASHAHDLTLSREQQGMTWKGGSRRDRHTEGHLMLEAVGSCGYEVGRGVFGCLRE